MHPMSSIIAIIIRMINVRIIIVHLVNVVEVDINQVIDIIMQIRLADPIGRSNWRDRPQARSANCDDYRVSGNASNDNEIRRNFVFVSSSNDQDISSTIEILQMKVKHDYPDIFGEEFQCSRLQNFPSHLTERPKSLKSASYIAALFAGNKSKETRFLIDSGADNHIVNERRYLSDCQPVENLNIQCAHENQSMQAIEKGNMNIEVMNRRNELSRIRLRDVLLVPGLHENLLSEDQMTAQGLDVYFTHDFADVMEPKSGGIVFSAKRIGLGE